MRLLISHGADPVHPGLRKLLVERPESKNEDDDDGDVCFGWTKRYYQRLMPDEVYQELKLLGFDINSSDFELIDTSDIRAIPSYNHRALRDPADESNSDINPEESESDEEEEALKTQ